MELKEGQVVVSAAGRDKGTLLAVVAVTPEGVWVCDGKERPLERPKRKNPRHIRGTSAVLDKSSMATNRRLKQALREHKMQ